MAMTLSHVSLGDSAQVTRASALERTRERPVESTPTAADPLGPAVVNHVRGAEPSSARGETALQPTASQKPSAAERPDEKRADAGRPKEEPAEEEHAEEIRALERRDAEVRAHEQAHAAAGGAYAGAPSFSYQTGPDGRRYAVSGEVSIDVSPIAGDPEATIQKMQQVKRAALAPGDPSGADRAIAATANALIQAARAEQTSGNAEARAAESAPQAAGATAREAFGGYERRSAGALAYAQSAG